MKNRLFAALLLAGFAFGGAAHASAYIVNNNGDTADAAPGDNFCGDSNDDCTLRAALQEANAHAGADVINFDIPGAGVHTITPLTALPPITDPVVIDGLTQPSAAANTKAVGDNAKLLIEINGSNINAAGDIFGFLSGGAGSTLRGVVINRVAEGVVIQSSNTVVEGCFFGINPQGTATSTQPTSAGGSGGDIFIVSGDNNRIGGTTPAARNVIVSNTAEGVRIGNGDASRFVVTNTLVQGNYIGTNAQGTVALNTHGFIGVSVFGAVSTTIGGLTPTPGTGAGNLISGNGNLIPVNGVTEGIGIDVNTTLAGATPITVTIQGNLIGTNATGTAAIPNVQYGIAAGTSFNQLLIGGPQAGARNVISGNGTQAVSHGGLSLGVNGSSGVTVQNNLIGVALDGTTPLANQGYGILTRTSSDVSVLLGGTVAGEGNTIANNTNAGVYIGGDVNNFSSRVAVLGNSISANGGLGINVAGQGGNDAGDSDFGPNGLQNFPVITGVAGNVISATLNSEVNKTYRVEFFVSDAADPSGFGEGQTFLGFKNVTTNATGDTGTFTFTAPISLVGKFISATATDSISDTSVFSAAFAVASGVPPTIGITNSIVTEGNSGTTNATFTVTLSAASNTPVTVDFATAGGSATPNVDFTSRTGTLTIPARQTSGNIIIAVRGDLLDEDDESYSVHLSSAVGATLPNADTFGLGAILDDDTSTISINNVRVTEGNAGTKNAVFTATLSNPKVGQFVVDFATENGTATAGSDYNATGGQLIFASGETTKTITVPVRGDTTVEPDETFFVNLSQTINNGEGGSIINQLAQGTGSIINDDSAALPTLSVNDVSVTEGTGKTKYAIFTLTLSRPSNTPVSVKFSTHGNEATAPFDFISVHDIFTIPVGATTAPVKVQIATDGLDENDETFRVVLTDPQGATLLRPIGIGTIVDDDTASVSINDVSMTEGNSGIKDFVFGVFLSTLSDHTQTVTFSTSDGTAQAGKDYQALSGTITFPPTFANEKITIHVTGDKKVEPDETFFVNLSVGGSENNGLGGRAVISDAQGMGTIVNDDAVVVLPEIRINNVAVTEGNAGTKNATFTVTLSAASNTPVSVQFATADGLATAPSDYAARTGSLTIPAGQITGTINVVINGDTVVEPDETFFINLSNPQGATIADNRGLGRIVNDDSVVAPRADLQVTQTVNPTAVAVGQTAVFTITVKNNGPTDATGVVLNDTLPSGATFISASPAAAANANGVLHFNLGTLNVGQSRVIRVTLRLNTPGNATNTAVASSPISDPAQANNTAAATAPVGAQIVTPQITITASSFSPIGGYLPGLFTPRRLAQTLTLRNNGPALRGPISLILDALSGNAQLSNAAGKTTSAQPPAGRPFVSVLVGSDNLLSTGETATVRLEFAVSGNGNVTYSPVVIAGAGAR